MSDWMDLELTDDERHEWALTRARMRVIARKRRTADDPNLFIENVLKDEQGERLRQAPFHREWQATLTAHDRVVLFAGMEHGKTIQLCVARVLWELGTRMGRGESPRIAIISKTEKQAKKPLSAIKSHIEQSDDLHAVFPHLQRGAFETWSTSDIRLRPVGATTLKDPTVQVLGVGGAILGGRLELAVIDDVLNLENTWTHARRAKMIEWFEANIPGRIVEGGSIWMLGTAWHPKDLMHHLARNKEYTTRRYPITSKPQGQGKILWPEMWTVERIAKRRHELTPYRYGQQYDCRAVDDATSRFESEWFAICAQQGRGLVWPQPTPMDLVITGVDLGVSRKRGSGETCLFTVGVDGVSNRRRPLAVNHGLWKKRDIIERIKGVYRKYGSIFMVENNAAQDYIVQELEDETNVTVVPYTTGRRKRDPIFGIESLGVDLQNRRWELACDERGNLVPVLELWRDQCMEWKPEEHPGDILMGSYLALEGIRRFEWGGGSGIDVGGVEDADLDEDEKPRDLADLFK